jgi:hypothetical protein
MQIIGRFRIKPIIHCFDPALGSRHPGSLG